MTYSENFVTHEAISVSNNSHCTTVAKEALVHRSIADANRHTNKTSLKGRSVSSTRANIYHPDPKIFNLTAWHLSTEFLKIKAFQTKLENFYQHHREKEHRLTTIVNSESSVVGVINGIKIPIQYL